MREIHINFSEAGWELFDKELEKSGASDKKRVEKYGFADLLVFDEKLTGTFDIGDISDEVLNIAMEDEIMQEICKFKVFKLMQDVNTGFQGTFIDALTYIKNNYKG